MGNLVQETLAQFTRALLPPQGMAGNTSPVGESTVLAPLLKLNATPLTDDFHFCQRINTGSTPQPPV